MANRCAPTVDPPELADIASKLLACAEDLEPRLRCLTGLRNDAMAALRSSNPDYRRIVNELTMPLRVNVFSAAGNQAVASMQCAPVEEEYETMIR